MPELKPLPCPYCGTEEIEVWDGPANFMECQYCHMTGPHAPSESSAIGLWNSLPSALTWTTDPPKVAGWYWHHMPPAFGTVVEYFDPEISEAGCGQWAGPIQAPAEPEES